MLFLVEASFFQFPSPPFSLFSPLLSLFHPCFLPALTTSFSGGGGGGGKKRDSGNEVASSHMTTFLIVVPPLFLVVPTPFSPCLLPHFSQFPPPLSSFLLVSFFCFHTFSPCFSHWPPCSLPFFSCPLHVLTYMYMLSHFPSPYKSCFVLRSCLLECKCELVLSSMTMLGIFVCCLT